MAKNSSVSVTEVALRISDTMAKNVPYSIICKAAYHRVAPRTKIAHPPLRFGPKGGAGAATGQPNTDVIAKDGACLPTSVLVKSDSFCDSLDPKPC